MRELRGDWRDIFNGFSVALDLKKLLLGFIGIALTWIIAVAGPFYMATIKNPSLLNDFKMGSYGYACKLFFTAWQTLSTIALWKLLVAVAAVYLMLLIVWAFFGGAITRIAAINLAKDEGLELGKSLSFTTKKYVSFLMPIIISFLGFLFFFFWNFLGGLVGRIPFVGEILVMVFLPLAILSGFIMVFIIIGFLFSAHMFYPTIGVEGSDSFDAISRSFSYLYSRPWHYIWYQLVALVYGAVTTAFVWLFGYFMIIISLWAGAVGMGAKFTVIMNSIGIGGKLGALNCPLSHFGISLPVAWLPDAQMSTIPTTYHIAAFILMVWLVLVVGFILAYSVSYFFSSQTIIYLLMRKKVDEIDVKEVWDEEEETNELPAPETKPEEKKEEPKPEEKK
ncbi:MAG: hypothetical protein HY811_05280 [Planctomycetes bacterium]|nr:hypothetical protein [Planctomycetota bacterium]